METQNLEDEQIRLIKSHLFESLDILKSIQIKKHKTFMCCKCKTIRNITNRRRKADKEYCYDCFMELFDSRIWNCPNQNPLDISNIPEEKLPRILNPNKQPTKYRDLNLLKKSLRD